MIYHYKDKLQDLTYSLGTHFKYSDDFTFVPFRVKGNHEFIVQTPKLFTPYGIQQNDKSKDYLIISFQNSENDPHSQTFLNDLRFIFKLIHSHFKNTYQVNPFLKEYKGETIMNLKMKDKAPIYGSTRSLCEDLPIYSYASYIIQLAGIWISKDQVWFQWYTHQCRLENNISLSDYAFKDSKIPIPPPPPPPPPPPLPNKDKYQKMIFMGIPTAAVNQQKQMDAKASINPEMLLSVTLKKGKSKKDIIKSDMNGFEPPSLDSLQVALQNLRNIITDKHENSI